MTASPAPFSRARRRAAQALSVWSNCQAVMPRRWQSSRNWAVRSTVKRVASAVGEGAMAVQFAHERLKEM
jgi:hypothetical protein